MSSWQITFFCSLTCCPVWGNIILLKLRQIKSIRSNFDRYLQTGINLLGNLEKYYHTSNIETKQKLIGSIFPEKLVFVDGKVRTARINEVLRLILLNDKDCRDMKKDNSHQIYGYPLGWRQGNNYRTTWKGIFNS